MKKLFKNGGLVKEKVKDCDIEPFIREESIIRRGEFIIDESGKNIFNQSLVDCIIPLDIYG